MGSSGLGGAIEEYGRLLIEDARGGGDKEPVEDGQ